MTNTQDPGRNVWQKLKFWNKKIIYQKHEFQEQTLFDFWKMFDEAWDWEAQFFDRSLKFW